MKHVYLLFFLIISFPVIGQNIFTCGPAGELYSADFKACTVKLSCNLRHLLSSYDMTFDPNGRCFILSSTGQLREVNLGACTKVDVHVFPNTGQVYNSMVTDANGLFYITGDSGRLYTYDLSVNKEKYLGRIPYYSYGDLTFYKGALYMAANNNTIVKVDLSNPSNSTIALNLIGLKEVYGVFSYAETCSELKPYLISLDEIYEIDFDNKSLTFICKLPVGAAGAASTYEFYGSNPIELNNIFIKSPTCNYSNGNISINASGGIGSLLYSIDGINYYPTNTFSDIPSGHYTIYIKDDNKCILTDTVELIDSISISIDLLEINHAYCGLDNGSFTIIGSGGVGQLEYSINRNDYQSSGIFENLSAGTYTVTIKDQNGCITMLNSVIQQSGIPSFASINFKNATCEKNNGSITIFASGGKGNLLYSINGINFFNHNSFDSLSAGSYTITIKDEVNCTSVQTVLIQQTGTPYLTNTIKGDAYCDQDNGFISVTAAGGDGLISYSIDSNNYVSAGNFDNLKAGRYNIKIQDESGCKITHAQEIQQKGKPLIKDLVITNPYCNLSDGNILINAVGGFGPLVYSISGSNINFIGRFDNLTEGVYLLKIQDSLKCEIVKEIQLEVQDSIMIKEIKSTIEHCGNKNAMIEIIASGGKGLLRYKLDQLASQGENIFSSLTEGTHLVNVFDSLGCSASQEIEIIRECDVYLPNIFSPNDDGINDYFRAYVYPGTPYTVLNFTIFDRWGNLIYNKTNFPIDADDKLWWDGTNHDVEVNPGVYLYVMEIKMNNEKYIKIKGDLTLIK